MQHLIVPQNEGVEAETAESSHPEPEKEHSGNGMSLWKSHSAPQ